MDEKLNKIAEYLQKKRKKNVLDIMQDLKLEEYEVYGLVEILKNRGFLFDIVDGEIIKGKPLKVNDIYKIDSNLDHLKLLLISDTHLASKYDRLDILNYLYMKAEDRGVNYILHSGDVVDGRSNRPQHIYELKEASYTGQKDYVIDKYPKSDIPTYMIAGNHEAMWYKQCGADILEDITKTRTDLHYLGSDCEDIQIGKLRIRLYHGKGANAYAKSYKIQKYLDTVPLDERPHILQTGHTHQAFFMKQDKTNCFQTSCLQDLTPFERSQGFNNDKSCWWVDVDFDNKGELVNIKQELEVFDKKRIRRR